MLLSDKSCWERLFILCGNDWKHLQNLSDMNSQMSLAALWHEQEQITVKWWHKLSKWLELYTEKQLKLQESVIQTLTDTYNDADNWTLFRSAVS